LAWRNQNSPWVKRSAVRTASTGSTSRCPGVHGFGQGRAAPSAACFETESFLDPGDIVGVRASRGHVRVADLRGLAQRSEGPEPSLESWGTTDDNLLRFDGSVFYNANFVGATYDTYPISFVNADFACATFDAAVTAATGIDWTGATCPDGTAADPADGCAGHLTRGAGCP
jgi:hypothetical protein